MGQEKRRIAIAMTGASGAPYFMRLVERLRSREELSLHVMISDGGKRVLAEESDQKWPIPGWEDISSYANKNIGASVASGSFKLHALAIAPCSMNTVSAIAWGMASNLITRCAAVQLKEDRKLIVVPRETPLSLPNLKAMTALKEAGACVMPASPGFYHKPENVMDLVDSVVDRVIDQLEIDDPEIKRWNPQ